MPVYVDPLFNTEGWSDKWPYKQACHMMADSEEELLEFARKLGLKKSWIQRTSLVHFDLTETKRILAIRFGAIPVERGFRPCKNEEKKR